MRQSACDRHCWFCVCIDVDGILSYFCSILTNSTGSKVCVVIKLGRGMARCTACGQTGDAGHHLTCIERCPV